MLLRKAPCECGIANWLDSERQCDGRLQPRSRQAAVGCGVGEIRVVSFSKNDVQAKKKRKKKVHIAIWHGVIRWKPLFAKCVFREREYQYVTR